MFIISLTYKKPLETVDAHLEEHVAYLKAQYAAGLFLASGRKNPRTGGIILARADSREAVEAAITKDPFYTLEIAEYEITEFLPTMTSPELEFLK